MVAGTLNASSGRIDLAGNRLPEPTVRPHRGCEERQAEQQRDPE
jgi:hypothetical protein